MQERLSGRCRRAPWRCGLFEKPAALALPFPLWVALPGLVLSCPALCLCLPLAGAGLSTCTAISPGRRAEPGPKGRPRRIGRGLGPPFACRCRSSGLRRSVILRASLPAGRPPGDLAGVLGAGAALGRCRCLLPVLRLCCGLVCSIKPVLGHCPAKG